IHTYIQLKPFDIWHNVDYIHGYALFNHNLIAISVKYQHKTYTYFILKYGVPKILFKDLRTIIYYLM
ncbi:MAG: hypothetical protein RLZZ210_593, partial [Pseudomonadota bacterium]